MWVGHVKAEAISGRIDLKAKKCQEMWEKKKQSRNKEGTMALSVHQF